MQVWDVLAIAEYLHELFPQAQMMPADRAARARCRSISGEIHAGFAALRASLPVNLRAFRPNFPIWSGVRADIERVTEIWSECIETWGGPYLFGARLTVADAMYAPVCTRFATYDVDLDPISDAYKHAILATPDMRSLDCRSEARARRSLRTGSRGRVLTPLPVMKTGVWGGGTQPQPCLSCRRKPPPDLNKGPGLSLGFHRPRSQRVLPGHAAPTGDRPGLRLARRRPVLRAQRFYSGQRLCGAATRQVGSILDQARLPRLSAQHRRAGAFAPWRH